MLAVIVALGVGIPFLSALTSGAIDIPHNDDWSYSRIALHLADHGELKLLGWNQPSLIGHLVWALPFLAALGDSLLVLHLAQSLAAAAGLCAVYLVSREFLSRDLALLATGLVAASPGYALLATTYMTDTTAFAAQVACLAIGLRALNRGRAGNGLLALSLLIGIFGYTIRDISLAAPVAVLAGRFVVLKERRDRVATIGMLAAILVLAVAFFAWRHSLPGDEKPWLIGDAPYYDRTEQVIRAFFTCAFALSPLVFVVFLSHARDVLSRLSAAAAGVVLVLGSITIVRGGGAPLTLFSGNSLTRFGAVDIILPGRPVLFSRPVWGVMTLVALIAGALLAAILVRGVERLGHASWRVRRTRPAAVALTVFTALTVAALVLRAASGTAVWDRYLWIFVVVLAVVLGRTWSNVSGRLLLLATTGTVALAVASLAVVLEEHASSVERWNAGKAAVSSGVPATSIDAGFEWMGWHYPYVVGAYFGPPRWRPPATWYNVAEFPASANCVVMSFSPFRHASLRSVATRTYHPFAFWGKRKLYVYRNPPACRS